MYPTFSQDFIILVIFLLAVIICTCIATYCLKVNESFCQNHALSLGLFVCVPIGLVFYAGGIRFKSVLLYYFGASINKPNLPLLELGQITPEISRRGRKRKSKSPRKSNIGGINFIVGIATKDYVILAADKASIAYGAILSDEVKAKEYRLGEKSTMMCVGEDGDIAQFGDWIKENVRLFSICNGYKLAPRGIHQWIRHSMAFDLRNSEVSYPVDLLIGGYDDYEGKAFLGTIDYLGKIIDDQPYVFRGFPGGFCYAIMDREYSKDMSEEKGMYLFKKCITESKKRFFANLVGFKVVVIDKNGYRKLPDINF